MKFYRYEMENYFEDMGVSEKSKGYVCGNSYADAMAKLEAYCTTPSGKCDLVSINSFYELDVDDILSDVEIDEIRECEKEEK